MVDTKVTVKSLENHSQQVRETYRYCFINEHVVGKVLYIQPLIRAEMNHWSIWNRLVFVLNLCQQAFKSYGRKENGGWQYTITNSPTKIPMFLL